MGILQQVSAELRRIQCGNIRPAWGMVPLMIRSHRIGIVILSSSFVHQWNGTDLQPYQATAANCISYSSSADSG